MRERIVPGIMKKYANNSLHAILYFIFQRAITQYALIRIAQKVTRQTVMTIFIVLMLVLAQMFVRKKSLYFLAEDQ